MGPIRGDIISHFTSSVTIQENHPLWLILTYQGDSDQNAINVPKNEFCFVAKLTLV